MIFIKYIGRKENKKGNLQSVGWFFCECCEKYVERPLSYKKNKSCGCMHYIFIKESKNGFKHGGFGTKLYNKWLLMKKRCSYKDLENKSNYFDRGIIVCDKWLNKKEGFINFRDWALSHGYKEGLTIDRIDNDKGYCPENCRWITLPENSRNKRTTKLSIEKVKSIIEKYNTGKYSMRMLAQEYNVKRTTISKVVNKHTWRDV